MGCRPQRSVTSAAVSGPSASLSSSRTCSRLRPSGGPATFVLGHVWRYRYDKFGWTTRSSQLYESRLLRLGSPLFHFGILLVIGGHVFGILVPEAATRAAGISETAYHAVAVALGTVSGVVTRGLLADPAVA